MTFSQNGNVSVEEFFQIRETNEAIMEYIDGIVYMSPSPSTKHQRISRRLERFLEDFLDNKPCEMFHAPYDIQLESDKLKGKKIVVPDISIICDKSGFTDERYIGVPELIVEILSPSNQSHDLVTKLNLYMDCGVPEYWIVNPMLKAITVYTINDNGMYEQHDMKTETGSIHSKILDGFRVEMEELFKQPV
ncbi:Uma2 family endonuclease [Bacillus niameyensis]|uniref:Uma2 family endonuclease n=1 Tax=Bacillus niameyensis TaxID=1522308 RepID=UPI000780BF84|nr:Uma2 family endonuclease [Bacillus niameyensis]